MKKIILYTLISLVTLLNGCGKKTDSFTESQVIKANAQESINSNKKNTLSVESKITIATLPVSLTEDEEIEKFQNELAEQYKAEMGEEVFNNSYRGKMFNKDPRVTLKIEDHNPAIQQKIREQLEFIKNNGYAQMPQEDMDDLYETKSELYSYGNAADFVKFELSKLPEDMNTNYEGFTREGISPNSNIDIKAPVIRRVFNHNGTTVLLQEESAKNGSNHFTEDFINAKIGDYPAIYTIYQSSDQKVIHELLWNTDQYRYALYLLGEQNTEIQKEQMKTWAKEITRLNAK
jgi:hypothetical protein